MNLSLNPLKWNLGEAAAAGKHALSFMAGGIAVAAVWGLVSQSNATDLTRELNDLWAGLEQTGKAIAALASTVTLIYTSLKAANNASPKTQAQNLTSLPPAEVKAAVSALPETANRNKLIDAVSKMEEVRGIVVPESVARATGEKVVSTPAAVGNLPLAVPRVAA